MSKDLAKCRFCGEEENIIVRETGVCWCECQTCKCRGPVAVFRKDAVDAWNNGFKKKEKSGEEK